MIFSSMLFIPMATVRKEKMDCPDEGSGQVSRKKRTKSIRGEHFEDTLPLFSFREIG